MSTYSLRNDILEWGKKHSSTQANILIDIIQRKNPIPQQISYEQGQHLTVEKRWPERFREISRQRLVNIKLWPKKLPNKLMVYKRVEVKLVQKMYNELCQWGTWVIDNFQVLMTSQYVNKINLRIEYPSSYPKSINDSATGDLELFESVRAQMNSIFREVIKRFDPGVSDIFYQKKHQKVKIKLLKRKIVFLKDLYSFFKEADQGETGRNMKENLGELIKELEEKVE